MVNDDSWRHKTVNEKRLTNLKNGKGSDSGVHLFDKTLNEYINDDEYPRFILAARKKAPKISGPNRPTWNGDKVDGMPMHLITDNRWLIVVGKRGGDSTFEIEFEDITSIEYSNGIIGHKINISTDSNKINIPISNVYEENILKLVTEYIQNPSKFKPEDHKSIIVSSGSEDKPEVEELINKARHKSVDKKRLTNLKSGFTGRYLYDKSLIEYLHKDEQPHYIIEGNLPIKFSGSNPPQNAHEGSTDKILNLVTDDRWIITSAKESGDEMWEIYYGEIENIELQSSTGLETIFIDTSEYSVEIQQMQGVNKPVEEAVNYVKGVHLGNQESEDEFESIKIIDRAPGSDNPLYAKLIVPTKSSGATFTSKGWSIGGDIVRGTSSKGKIEDDSWENYVKKLELSQDHVEIGVTHGDLSATSDNKIHQTIRIHLSEISDVRIQKVEGFTGFIFETEGDVYQFKLGKKGALSTATQADAEGAVSSIKTAIQNASDTQKENNEKTEEKDPVEKLSEIKELHDQDVLTDEEFESKKQELLDQI
jgi:hypothetical protein